MALRTDDDRSNIDKGFDEGNGVYRPTHDDVDLADSEKQALAQMEQNAGKSADSSQENSNIKSAENVGRNEFGYNNTKSSEKLSRGQKVLKFAKSRGGAGLAIGGGIAVIIAIISTILGPFTLLQNLQANAISKNDSRSSILERRLVRVLELKTKTNSQPCSISKASCRLGRMPSKMLERLDAQGIKAFDGNNAVNLGDEDTKGKYVDKNPTHYEFTDKDGTTKRIPASQFVDEYKKNPVFRSAFKKAYNMRYYSWVGKTIRSVFYSKNKLEQNGGVDDDRDQRPVNGEETNAKTTEEKINERVDNRLADPESTKSSAGIREKVAERVRGLINRTGKKVERQGGDPVLAVATTACLAINIPRFVAGTIRAIQVAQLLVLVNDLVLSPAGKQKSGNMTPEAASAIGTKLTEKPIVNGVAKGSALDSAVLLSAIGVNKNKVSITKSSKIPGYSAYSSKLVSSTGGIASSTKSTCNKIASPQAAAVSAAVMGAISAGTAGIGGVALGALKGVAKLAVVFGGVAAAIAVLEKTGFIDKIIDAATKVAEGAVGNFVEGAKGVELGDALGYGILSFFSLGSLAGGAAVLKKSQVAGFKKVMGSVDDDYKQEALATLSPFDISSSYTFMGSIVSKLSFSGLSSNPTNFITNSGSMLLQAPAAMLFPKTFAAADEVEAACGYADTFDLDEDIAVNAAGYPCTGIPEEYIDMEPTSVFSKVADDVDPDSGIPTEDGAITSMLADCSQGDLESISGCTIDDIPRSSGSGDFSGADTSGIDTSGFTQEEQDQIAASTGPSPSFSTEGIDASKRAAESLYLADKQVNDILDGSDEEIYAMGPGVGVMTFNILGQGQGDDNGNDGGIPLAKRSAAAKAIVDEKKPAIVGFQEVNDIQFRYLQSNLTGYSSYPTTYKGALQPESIFWDTSVFTLVDKGIFKYPKRGGSSEAPWVKLQAIAGGGYIYAFNTHPATGGQWAGERKKTIVNLLDKIKEVNTDGSPVVVVGDFNATTYLRDIDNGVTVSELPSSLMKAAGYSDALDIAVQKINDDYKSSHRDAGRERQKDETKDLQNKIDHIFVSGDITVNTWENVIDENSKTASDHTPLLANISIPGITAGSSTSPAAGGGVQGDDYKKECKRGYGGVGFISCSRQCVDFVLFRLAKHGIKYSAGGGNGKDIARLVGTMGFKVDSKPAVNSVFSKQTGGGGAGHTGMVSKVNSDGSIVVEEYNYTNSLGYGTRTLTPAQYKGLTFAHTETKYR